MAPNGEATASTPRAVPHAVVHFTSREGARGGDLGSNTKWHQNLASVPILPGRTTSRGPHQAHEDGRGNWTGSLNEGTMPKNATPQSAPTTSQSEGHDDPDSSISELEEKDSRSGNVEDLGSKFDASSGSQSDNGSGGSAGSKSGSQEDATTSLPTVNIEAETRIREEVDATDEDIEITTDDTMVMYVNMHEPDLGER
uniref:Integrase core domain containing protein n=1 Tax=Solanum tuberosum TaxID=4113 RepID=M1D854_SOLTU